MEALIISGIALVFGLVALTISFGRYMYQRGRIDGLEEAARIMAEMRGVNLYETTTQSGAK